MSITLTLTNDKGETLTFATDISSNLVIQYRDVASVVSQFEVAASQRHHLASLAVL